MIIELLQVNYATLIIVVCLFVFIVTNDYFARRIRTLFLISCAMIVGLMVADSVEYWCASRNTFTPLRTLTSAIGYSLRPFIIYMVILLLTRQKSKMDKWLAIPLVINAMIAFSAFFTDIAYSYTMDNQFVRGPIGYFAFVTSGFYEIVLFIYTINLYKSVKKSETVIAVVIIIMLIMSSVMESILHMEGLINTSGMVSLTFYYLYLNTQQFKRDPLTNALNRRCFFRDAEKRMANLSAVISIDLNELKKWNDQYGHAQGDDAICSLVQCVNSALPENCFLYRVGGDEFMILCFNQKSSAVEKIRDKIQKNISKTPYSCAIGIAYNDGESDFNKLCSWADKAMYEEKKRTASGDVSSATATAH